MTHTAARHGARPGPARLGSIATTFVTVAALSGALGAATARANNEVLVNEPFSGSTMSSSNWVLPSAPTGSNKACLTAGLAATETPVPGCGLSTPDAAGSGALRLTSASTTQEGGVAYSLSVPTVDGIDATFDAHQYGSASRADGIAFFLAAANPADPAAPASIGQPGGSLGYSANGISPGMTYGYLGIGLDVYGNYANSAYDGSGCVNPGWRATGTRYPNNVSVRGPGNGTAGYCVLNSTAATGSMSGKVLDASAGTRASSTVPVEVVINPSAGSVTTTSGLTVAAQSYAVAFTPVGSTQQTLSGPLPSVAGDGFPASYYNPSTGIPYQLTFGWVGSTGGSTEIHEVGTLNSATVAGTPPALTASLTDDASGTPPQGSTINYAVTAGNGAGTSDDPGPITVTDTLPAGETPGTPSGTGWSCSVSGQVATCTDTATLATGSSLPAIDIPATVAASPGTALTDRAVVSSDTGVPAQAQDAVTVATPPSVATNPTFTLANTDGYTGSALAVQGTYAGTTPLTITDTWQHCTAAGTNCTDIPGATGLTYATGPADYGYRLRLHEQASNVAGSVVAYSAYIAGVPSTTLTSEPSDPSNSATSTFTASSSAGAAFQCSLDSGAFANCATSPQFTGLPDGMHTLTMRAVYAGLSDPIGASDSWLVDTAPPTDTSTCGVPDGENGTFIGSAQCTVQGSDAVSGIDHVAYQIDSGPTLTTASGTTTASATITGDGSHELSTEVFNGAGTASGWMTQTVLIGPSVELTGPSTGATATADPTVTYAGDPGDEFTLSVDGTVVATGVIPAAGAGELTLPAALSNGRHAVAIGVTDAAGNTATDSVVITVDTDAPGEVAIVHAPAHDTAQRSAAFAFSGATAGQRYQCSLNGVAYAPCDAAVTFTRLTNGPNFLLVRLVSSAGSPGAGTEYAWTVDTARPPAPPVLSGPASATTPGNARFALSPEPGATLRCSLDGRRYVPCTQRFTLRARALGPHTLKVVQVADTGTTSAPTIYRWRVLGRTGPAGLPRSAKATIATRSTAYGGDELPVGCSLNAGSVRICSVDAYWHGRLIGSGSTLTRHAGAESVVVSVALSERGRDLLARALGGLPIALRASVTPFRHAVLPAGARTVAYDPYEFVVPDVLFASGSYALTSAASAIISQIAAELRGASTVRCEGNTDSLGGVAYNLSLGMDRARAVCDALRALRVQAGFSLLSLGESRPVASNATAAGRRLNRRVVVQVSFLDAAPRPAPDPHELGPAPAWLRNGRVTP